MINLNSFTTFQQQIINNTTELLDMKSNAIPLLILGSVGFVAGGALQLARVSPLLPTCIFGISAIALTTGIFQVILGFCPNTMRCCTRSNSAALQEVNIDW